MFGNNKPFGTASAFGTSTFGSTTTPFGQNTSAFGAKPAGSNVFGTSAFGTATPSGGSLFGSTTPASGTSLFGQPSTAFGAPASTSTGTFGFGAASTTGSIFGSAAPSTQTSGGLFGSSSTSAFGTPRPTFGGFGSTSTSTGLFGQSSNTGTSLFGSSGFNTAVQSGTTIKFNPPTGTDTMMKGGSSTNISTRHQCITCMKEYENKSLEELRVEDYAANRKGPQTGGIGFGTPAPQTGLFGAPTAASTSAFSFGGTTQTKPLFGNTGATNTFGSGGLFGQTSQNQNTGGLFGKPAGTTNTSAFNFGSSTGTSLFGQNTQQKPLFGQPSGSTGLFGSTATTQATGFGTTTGFGGFGTTNQPSTGLFGAKPTGFGATSTTTTNTFSFVNPTNMTNTGLFGQKPATSAFGSNIGFGTQPSAFGSFGTTSTSNTGLFGQPKPTTSAFGNTGNTFGSGLGTGFGTSSFSMGLGSNTSGSLFGANNANKTPGFSFGNTGSTGFGFGASNPSTGGFNFGPNTTFNTANDPNATVMYQQAQQQILAMAVNPFGDSPLFRNALKPSSHQEEVLKPTNPAAQKALLTNNQYKVSPLPATKVKPKPLTPVPNGKVSLFDGLEDEEPSLGNATFVPKRSIKKLVLKHHSNNNSSFMLTSNLSASSDQPTQINLSISLQKNSQQSINSNSSQIISPVKPLTIDVIESPPQTNIERHPQIEPAVLDSNNPTYTISKERFTNNLDDTIFALHSNRQQPRKTFGIGSEFSDTDISNEEYQNLPQDDESQNLNHSDHHQSEHPSGIILTRPGYYTIPSLKNLDLLVDKDGNCFVEDFTIGREGYGKVTFPGKTNVAGLNLDEIVHFQKKEITIYPDDDNKPPIGEGLNRKAEVTLDAVWPTDKTTHSLIKDPDRLTLMGYKDKIEKSTSRLGATFIDYKPETGSWTFQVRHFSKYGLEDSDDEMEVVPKVPEQNAKVSGVPIIPKINGHLPLTNDIPKGNYLNKKPVSTYDEDEEMEGIALQQPPYKDINLIEDDDFMDDVYSPTRQLINYGIDAERIRGMKVSFFQDDIDDNWGNHAATHKAKSNLPICPNDSLEETVPFKNALSVDSRKDLNKRLRSLDYEKNNYNMISGQFMYGETGIQNSMSSLSLSTVSRQPTQDLISLFPLIKTSHAEEQSKKLPAAVNKISLKPFSQSVLYNKQHLLADAGYFMGRRFRVGWQHGLQFTHLEAPSNTSFEKGSSKFLLFGNDSGSSSIHKRSAFCVSLSKISNESNIKDLKAIQQNLVEALELQLKHSESTYENDVPLFVPKPGIQVIHALASLFEKQVKDTGPIFSDSNFIFQCHSVWNLLVALWGKISSFTNDNETSNYAWQIARREALSQWLIKTTQDKITNAINNLNENDYLSMILHYLSARRISDAIKLAHRFHDYRLSMLLAQAEGTNIIRHLISKQISNWKQNNAVKFINHKRLVIYTILSGMLIWESDIGTINCCENLDWKRSLALHLWYYCAPTSSIQNALDEYDKAFQGFEKHEPYCVAPLPPYLENSQEPLDDPNLIFDTSYHILKLYCDRSHCLDKMLMPQTYTSDNLDYRLSWFLQLSLLSIGYNIPTDLAYSLHLDFASQLESMNMWHWAIFPLLHLPDIRWRTKHIKDLLLRNISIEQTEENEERETFLKEQLLVPQKWIYEAKAIKSHILNKHADEAWYWLKAGFWTKSHSIVVKYLASDSIINEDYDYLLKYLNELAIPERSSTILDWPNGGQVYLDYINVSQMVEEVLSNEASAYDLEKITPEVISLCTRLSSIPAPSLKDRLSLSEMAKKTATILRSIFTLQASRTRNTSGLQTLATYFKQLPMPHDYAIEENRLIAHGFLREITTEI